MFELSYSQTALDQLEKLDKTIKIRILSSLERIKIRPYSHIKKLVGNPYFSLRVGDYRIILEMKKNQLLILKLQYVLEATKQEDQELA